MVFIYKISSEMHGNARCKGLQVTSRMAPIKAFEMEGSEDVFFAKVRFSEFKGCDRCLVRSL